MSRGPIASGLSQRLYRRLYRRLAEPPPESELRGPNAELPKDVVDAQPASFVRHVAALTLTKSGDGLIDPKLVLSWLLGSLGAPAAAIGMLVPVREAVALLPQIALAPAVTASRRKRWIWAAGAAGQCLFVAAIAVAAALLEGQVAGWSIVLLVAGFALSRALCSVSYKPLVGVTLVRTTRGTAAGLAGTIAAATTFAFGALLATGVLPRTRECIIAVIASAALLWAAAALILGSIIEDGRAAERTEGRSFADELAALRRDRSFVRFVAVRSLLVGTALAPPYLVTSASERDTVHILGPFVLASAAAGVLSSYVWGRMADRSSRRVLMASGLVASVPLTFVAVASARFPQWIEGYWALPACLFVLMIAYQGVRLGRSTHLVDMAGKGQRATYAAVSNTLVGLVLVGGAGFGFVADRVGSWAVLAVFAAMGLFASWLAIGLGEVQTEDAPTP